jgi:hypothetical protein
MLSFLALAAREGIDVVGYQDSAEAFMPLEDKPVRITLHPRGVIAAGAAEREGARP